MTIRTISSNIRSSSRQFKDIKDVPQKPSTELYRNLLTDTKLPSYKRSRLPIIIITDMWKNAERIVSHEMGARALEALRSRRRHVLEEQLQIVLAGETDKEFMRNQLSS